MTTIGIPPKSERRIHRDDPVDKRAARRPLIERVFSLPGVDTPLFWWLIATLAVLNIIGLVMVLSASSVISLEETGSSWTYFTKQLEWTVLGLIAAFALVHVPLDRLRRFGLPALGLCVLGLIAVLIPGVGVTANGATRWIGFGPIQIQPSEIAKLAVIIVTADWLAKQQAFIDVPRVAIRPILVELVIVAGLVMLQPNLGTTIVISVIVFAILFAAGVPKIHLAFWGILGAVVALFAAFASDYRRARMLAFLNPWADPQHNGYQLIQSQVGLASGGIFGVGLGASKAKWGFLPFAHTDFIFAIIGEELGMVGAVVVVALFVGMAIIGLRIARDADSRFAASVAIGVTTWIVIQAFINIGVVIGILPITGVPLPFISYGGTSMLVTLAAMGVLANVARHPAQAPSRS